MKKLYIIIILNLFTFSSIAFAQSNWYFGCDTIDFEEQNDLIYIDTNNKENIWQIGKPNKVFFDTAFSGLKAILTDTVQNYPKNDTSSFIVIIPKVYYEGPQNTVLSFKSKWNLEDLKDFGFIDYSFYGDSAWKPLNSCWNYNDCNYSTDNICLENSYWEEGNQHFTDNEEKEFLITEKSTGWITFSYRWHWYTPITIEVGQTEPIQTKSTAEYCYPDSLCIMFTLISDSVESKNEGWMIDDIILSYQNSDDINEQEQNNVSIYPNPVTKLINIKLTDHSRVERLILYTISGQKAKETLATSNDISLQVEDLPSGVYMLQINMNNGNTSTKKIVIQH